MPCLRGVEVSLVAYPSKELIEEHPHPDGASVSLTTGDEATAAFTEQAASPAPVSPSVPNKKIDPKTSVYIATRPGSQFIIQYNVTTVPEFCKFLMFKVLVNGRHMATCGLDLAVRTQGTICQTLWAPSGQWQLHAGIEGRQFMFMRNEHTQSAAEDGGLIEVQVHRAESRFLFAPSIQEFRHARQYGLATPSTGLIDKPEDVKYYRYKLVDAKDTPFARFLFHYRSYESLMELNLIPHNALKQGTGLGQKYICPLFAGQSTEATVDSRSRSSSPESYISCMDGPADNDDRRPHRQSSNQASKAPGIDSRSRSRQSDNSRSNSRHTEQSTRASSRAPSRAPSQAPSRAPSQAPSRASSRAASQAPSRAPSQAPSRASSRAPSNPPLALGAPTRGPSMSPVPSLTPTLKRRIDEGDFDVDVEIAETKLLRYSKVSEKPKLLDVTSPTRSSSAFDISGSSRNAYTAASNASGRTERRLPTSAFLSRSDSTSTFGPAPGGHERLPLPDNRASRNSYQSTSSHNTDFAPRLDEMDYRLDLAPPPQGRPRANEMIQGNMPGQPTRAPPAPTNTSAQIYRGANTTQQPQVQRSLNQRDRPTNTSQTSRGSSISSSQHTSTYNALRDLGDEMLHGRRRPRDSVDSPSGSGSDRPRDSLQSPLGRGSSRYQDSIQSSFSGGSGRPRDSLQPLLGSASGRPRDSFQSSLTSGSDRPRDSLQPLLGSGSSRPRDSFRSSSTRGSEPARDSFQPLLGSRSDRRRESLQSPLGNRSGRVRNSLQSPLGTGSRRPQDSFPSPLARNPTRNTNRNLAQSYTPRHTRAGSNTTPTRASFAEQRWSPRNAPPSPTRGVTWEQAVRASPRIDIMDRIVSDLNGPDDFKENRPPPDFYDDEE